MVGDRKGPKWNWKEGERTEEHFPSERKPLNVQQEWTEPAIWEARSVSWEVDERRLASEWCHEGER